MAGGRICRSCSAPFYGKDSFAMKLWAGRFQKETDDKVNDFNSSISFDARLYRQDITGSIAHATMLGNRASLPRRRRRRS